MNQFIPISQPSITQKEIDYVNDAVTSTWISSLGKYIDRFEAEFAAFCGSRYAICVSNGTVAIQLALTAYGIGEGDEVIMPNLSFIATANATLHCGAKPVFADIDPSNLCLDPNAIEALITPKTKAIMPVHLYGHPAQMDAILKIANKHGLWVIEDAAEAHGATVNGKRVGSWGNCATFSFYGNKNLTTGEGGMITTDDEDFYNRCRHLRDHAMSKEKRYWHTAPGFNFRMTNIQAAIGCAQLERVADFMAKRQLIFDWYKTYLGDFKGVSLNNTDAWATNAYWLICLENKSWNLESRDAFMVELKKRGVDSRPYFYPMSQMPYINEFPDTPVTNQIYQQGINLPTYFDLKEEQVKFICEILRQLLDD
ncbi:DegT/DnrJ/EryC1/StrS family aminotransferase [Subsaximicrobium wynnwilliamsii]|uniref:GDP-perosamine synthase n=1 Tax=Subsaximicrobium wynnwilliamsii TaxID=291179 RepID=A0A5C6ZH74_9FLAO|nr:DegT/DnrJ/EryC1/StrS family aminotransferase [Subsaximicrobium wynnwilliamsii]TXD81370.1 DegT/DnrJ/EryC1/StrS family aminotransferase [Subsaximicrobium wynnwilliamsii]TXD89066.1 DegT/DnrJ/EryC1/StrS family aminotransferase [Subsaximicrobium wynnwilliamsii]TXE00744.1 DegT/DnrJ/EryC1/StrS family aminotransferase [Subsaximicrobium wynnwilliamsii]